MSFTVLLLIFLSFPSLIAASFSLSEVQQHNTPSDCWMVFENKIYAFDIAYIDNHDVKFMNIDEWCGKDMTEDFKTKAGSGEDHKAFSYARLEEYYIGDLTQSASETTNSSNNTKRENPYNFWLPALIGYGSYMVYWSLTKLDPLKKYKIFNKNAFNLTFNSLLLLGLIPSVGFGYFMIARYSFDELKDIDFDFLYWHVELSVAFAGMLAGHFLTRFTLYLAPLRLFLRRRRNVVLNESTKETA